MADKPAHYFGARPVSSRVLGGEKVQYARNANLSAEAGLGFWRIQNGMAEFCVDWVFFFSLE
ncbi:hypothetical protein [Novipirellula artificiosorum]|uniref:hypothetical protein n=1 Tax=Novipirellula artificiosorum TaxID=2528016 RepID=UPI0011B7D10E|nr:hypothetical protein [Novipirellula artificiosorum]